MQRMSRRIIVRPGRDQHRADALRDDRDVLEPRCRGLTRCARRTLHVAHRGAEARAVPALAGRTAVAAGVPGDKGEFRQVELIDQVRDPARMLVAAMEQHDGAPSAARRPPASSGRTARTLRASRKVPLRPAAAQDHCGACASGRRRLGRSASPARTRLTRSAPAVRQVTGISSRANPAARRRGRSTAASAPNTTARSLLPIGPS